MVDYIFRNFSKIWIAMVLLGVSIFFILLNDPPHSLCDSQLETFKEQQKHMLYPREKKKRSTIKFKATKVSTLIKNCQETRSLGDCGVLFHTIGKIHLDLVNSGERCISKIFARPEVRQALQKTLELMSQLAWGEVPPESISEKYGWLDSSQMVLFCKVQELLKTQLKEDWPGFRETLMMSLPSESALDRRTRWRKSLFSINCNMYL